MNYLDQLDRDLILNGSIPVTDLLNNSLFYPASEFDGGVIRDCNRNAPELGIRNFIYCDYGVIHETFIRQLDTIYGYRVLALRRDIDGRELTPNGWNPVPPPGLRPQEYFRRAGFIRERFISWAVMEREPGFGEDHGPARFSLLYLGGEGVASYQALYWSNRTTAKALAIIQPGTGFGGNWTDFRKKDGHLHWVVETNSHGRPDIVYYGGIGQDYDDFDWPGFRQKRVIRPYYMQYQGWHGGTAVVLERVPVASA